VSEFTETVTVEIGKAKGAYRWTQGEWMWEAYRDCTLTNPDKGQ
jgi:hypothetical protein